MSCWRPKHYDNKWKVRGVFLSKSISKLKQAAQLIKKQQTKFRCPICSLSLTITDQQSFICPNNHTFDIARQGYLNLLTRHVQTNYHRELFEARREVIVASGLFDMFNKKITNIINDQIASQQEITIIDMGSGEGSHLHTISHTLTTQFDKNITRIGIDISKEGILEAAKSYADTIWLVADLAKPPLNDQICDLMLNILSPSNYGVFNRILKPDGIVVKVVPRQNYLRELREYFHKDSEREDYSNAKTVGHFKRHFKLVDQSVIHYTKTLELAALKALVKMTPLTWHASKEKVKQFLANEKGKITIDLEVLVGKKL